MPSRDFVFPKQSQMSLVWVRRDGQTVVVSPEVLQRDIRLAQKEFSKSNESIHVFLSGNTYAMAVMLLATWRLGRSACALNPQEDTSRLSKSIAKIVGDFSLWVDPHLSSIHNLGHPYQLMEIPKPIDLEQSQDSEMGNPMNLIFTSGTTGHSKLVPQMPSQVLQNASDLIEHLKLSEGEIFATALPLYHVNALNFSLLLSWLLSGRLILFEAFQPRLFIEQVIQQRAQVVNVVPHMLKLIYEGVDLEPLKKSKDFRFFLSAASGIDSALAQKVLENKPLKVIQGFGLSEAVNFSCVMPLDWEWDEYEKMMKCSPRPSVGVPLKNSIIVLRNGQEVVTEQFKNGNVFVSGPTTMKGYVGEPQNLSEIDTGDVGRLMKDTKGRDVLTLMGRTKDVFKRMGHSVSLVEVEDYFKGSAFKGISLIAVSFEHELSGEELGLVVQVDGVDPGVENAIIEFCQKGVPAWSRPRAILFTNEAVFSSSGKPKRNRFSNEFQSLKNEIFGQKIHLFRSR